MIDAKDFVELVLQHGWPVVIALAVYRVVNLFFDWLSQRETAGKLMGIFNLRRRSLEKMLALPYLSRHTRNLARAELNKLSCRKLTGYSEPRLQELLIRICSRNNLPARYFTRWRPYLSEDAGKIVFARGLYRFAWWVFVLINLPLSTGYMIFMCYLLTKPFGLDNLVVIISINAALWYFPWLYISSPVAPNVTARMEEYVARFNRYSD
jgi:hypothetical protein